MTLRLFHTDSYDIVTVVGSHIANHIESEALIEIIRLVKSGESNDWKKIKYQFNILCRKKKKNKKRLQPGNFPTCNTRILS